MTYLHSKPVHYGLILALAAALAISSCDRPDGPAFRGLPTAEPDVAHVYVYRRGALAAYGQGFDVIVDGKISGRVSNASYLRLSLTPGMHRLQVAPGGRATMPEAEIQTQAGKKMFYEFVFPVGLEMQPLFGDALIAYREEREALSVMPELREEGPFLVRNDK